jgi:phosphoserine phosphatase RsbX
MEHVISRIMEWGVVSCPLEPEGSGDAYMMDASPHVAFLAVVDGLGHGREAAAASRLALDLLAGNRGEDLPAAVSGCHDGLRNTRGVVLALARIEGSVGRLTWLSIGNIHGVLQRADSRGESLIARRGVVGRRLPPLHASIVSIAPGDLLVLATDGIHADFARHISRVDSPQLITESIMAAHRTGTDDALVLALRYRGASL